MVCTLCINKSERIGVLSQLCSGLGSSPVSRPTIVHGRDQVVSLTDCQPLHLTMRIENQVFRHFRELNDRQGGAEEILKAPLEIANLRIMAVLLIIPFIIRRSGSFRAHWFFAIIHLVVIHIQQALQHLIW